MKLALGVVLLLHGALHLFGFAKGFGLAALPQLSLAISRPQAVAWLFGALAFGLAFVGLVVGSRLWGVAALVGVVVSQVMIAGQFADAKYGTIANVLILVPALISSAELRPSSLRSTFERRARALQQSTAPSPNSLVTAADLAHLPNPVQRYLERVGVVGKPKVTNVYVQGHMKMRRSPTEAWMDTSMEQYSSLTDLRRLFFMKAHKGPISFDVFHHFDDGEAHMQVKVLGLFPVADASGPLLTQSETVTVLNDLCLLAPAALIDSRLSWQALDDVTARVWLSHAGHRVGASLSFNASGELVDFVSLDRYQSDGKTSRSLPWSTPVTGYGDFDGYHLVSSAVAQWQEPTGLWTYAQFSIERVAYNVTR